MNLKHLFIIFYFMIIQAIRIEKYLLVIGFVSVLNLATYHFLTFCQSSSTVLQLKGSESQRNQRAKAYKILDRIGRDLKESCYADQKFDTIIMSVNNLPRSKKLTTVLVKQAIRPSSFKAGDQRIMFLLALNAEASLDTSVPSWKSLMTQ